MATLRQFQIALQDKLEEIGRRDELIDELEQELYEKDAEIERLHTELGKYRSLVANQQSGTSCMANGLQFATAVTKPVVYQTSAAPSSSATSVTVNDGPTMMKMNNNCINMNMNASNAASVATSASHLVAGFGQWASSTNGKQTFQPINGGSTPPTNGKERRGTAVSAEPFNYATMATQVVQQHEKSFK